MDRSTLDIKVTTITGRTQRARKKTFTYEIFQIFDMNIEID